MKSYTQVTLKIPFELDKEIVKFKARIYSETKRKITKAEIFLRLIESAEFDDKIKESIINDFRVVKN